MNVIDRQTFYSLKIDRFTKKYNKRKLNEKMNECYTLTFANPSILSVGSNPMEKMSLRIVEPTNVLTPEGRGNVTIIEKDTSMASQTSNDRRESSSETKANFSQTQQMQKSNEPITKDAKIK